MARNYATGTPEQFMSKVKQRIESFGHEIESSQEITAASNINFKVPHPFEGLYVPADNDMMQAFGYDVDPELEEDEKKILEDYGMEFVGYAIAKSIGLCNDLGFNGLAIVGKDSTGVLGMYLIYADRVHDLDMNDVKDVVDYGMYLSHLEIMLREMLDHPEFSYDDEFTALIITYQGDDESYTLTVPFTDLSFDIDKADGDLDTIMKAAEEV